jgi:leucyl-tRNA synthetase
MSEAAYTVSEPGSEYDYTEVERKWQTAWALESERDFDLNRFQPGSKFYNLVEFPYPSAEGLHVGHVYTYCGADTMGRYLRMKGRDVFQPIGFDSFGIHTENYAIRVGENPHTLTARTIINYRRQLEALGVAWDWSTSLTTSDPDYYHWTQWIFVKLFKAGLVEQQESSVVWCPSCLTVLAFEQLEGDRCERCESIVTFKVMKQWYLKITRYADKLLDTLDQLDWPEVSKRSQREWIGRSEGSNVDFEITGSDSTISVFTTRVDTLFGVTFLALAPDHTFIQELMQLGRLNHDVQSFLTEAESRLVTSRFSLVNELSVRGMPIGVEAVHPLTGERLPIYVADYVLGTYGTGAIMGVPAHDQRDFDFALAMGLPVRVVVHPNDGDNRNAPVYVGEGVLVNSDSFTGLSSADARKNITDSLIELNRGSFARHYRLHDWLVSRQRYWGSPIPIIYCPVHGAVPVPEEDLPVVLPDVEDFRPTGTGMSPLATNAAFVNTECPVCGEPARRETDVLDTFVESSWYFLRYPSFNRQDVPWDDDVTSRLLPVDLYAGGREHVTRHHLYARFVCRALHDLGYLPFVEPFARLRLHGLITKDGAKMSKSRGNVVNPDDYIMRVGADNLRTYLLFCGPWEDGGDFSDSGLQGVVRFSARLWRLFTSPHEGGEGGVDLRELDLRVAQVGQDIERLKFNVAISRLMELLSWLARYKKEMSSSEWFRATRVTLRLLAPFQPFLAEELWHRLGGTSSVHKEPWPDYDPDALRGERVTVIVQIDGKLRGRLDLPPGQAELDVVALARAEPGIAAHLRDKSVDRVVFVPDKLVNLVTQ